MTNYEKKYSSECNNLIPHLFVLFQINLNLQINLYFVTARGFKICSCQIVAWLWLLLASITNVLCNVNLILN